MSSSRSRAVELQRIESATVRAAGRALLQSYSTTADKLQAIDFLQGVHGLDSVRILIETLEEEVYFVANPRDLAGRNHPRAGNVAAAAARALARHDSPEGLTYLIERILDRTDVPLLRETAVFGLGGTGSTAALKAIAEVLDPRESFEILHAALLALRDSLATWKGAARVEDRAAIERISGLIRDAGPGVDLLQMGMRKIVLDLLCSMPTDQVIQDLIDTVTGSPNLDYSLFALDILSRVNVDGVREALSDILRDGRTDPEVLKNIGLILSREPIAAALETARHILANNSLAAKLLSLVAGKRERRDSQIEAAERILRSA